MKMTLIDINKKETTVRFAPIGWRSLLQVRSGTSKILFLKSVVRGLCLQRGLPVYSYVAEDPEGRPVMLSYLDGQPRMGETVEGD